MSLWRMWCGRHGGVQSSKSHPVTNSCVSLSFLWVYSPCWQRKQPQYSADIGKSFYTRCHFSAESWSLRPWFPCFMSWVVPCSPLSQTWSLTNRGTPVVPFMLLVSGSHSRNYSEKHFSASCHKFPICNIKFQTRTFKMFWTILETVVDIDALNTGIIHFTVATLTCGLKTAGHARTQSRICSGFCAG